MLKLSTLGRLDLVDEDGRRLEVLLAHPKCFALLSYLAVAYPGAFCRRDALLAVFWPELDESHARSALRQLLYTLRQASGHDVVVNEGDSIGIAEHRLWCDVVSFRRLLEQKDHEGALALYRGDYLEGFHLPGTPEFERWLDHERAKNRRAAAAATWALVERAQAQGDGEAARRRARQAVALEPYREPGWCRLITLLREEGDRAGAVLAYKELTETLERELGLPPSPETRAVVASLLSGERPIASEVVDPAGPAGPPEPQAALGTRPPSESSAARDDSLPDDSRPDPHAPSSRYRTRRTMTVGLAAVAVSVVGYGVIVKSPPARLPEEKVVVFPFVNLTGNNALDDLSQVAVWEITTGLERAEELRPVSADAVLRRLEAHEEPGAVVEIAEDLGAGTFVTGMYQVVADTLEILAEITRVTSAEVLYSVVSRGPVAEPTTVLRDLTSRLMGSLAVSLDPESSYWLSDPPRYEAYQEFLRGVERFYAGDEVGALAHQQEAYRRDTTFVTALVAAAGRHANLGQRVQLDSLLTLLRHRWEEVPPDMRYWVEYYREGLEGDRLGTLQVARDALSRYDDLVWGHIVALVAFHVGRPNEAVRALGRGDRNDPMRRWPPRWVLAADAFHLLERYQDARSQVETGLAWSPDHIQLRDREIRALVAMGDLERVDDLLEEAAGLEPFGVFDPGALYLWASAEMARHDHPEEARTVAARAEAWYRDQDPLDPWAPWASLQAGSPVDALRLAAAGVERNGEGMIEREVYGVALAAVGETSRALEQADWFGKLDRPFLNGRNTSSRATILAHLGRKAEAVQLLRRAHDEGWWSGLSLHSWSAFEPLWGFEPFEELVEPKG